MNEKELDIIKTLVEIQRINMYHNVNANTSAPVKIGEDTNDSHIGTSTVKDIVLTHISHIEDLWGDVNTQKDLITKNEQDILTNLKIINDQRVQIQDLENLSKKLEKKLKGISEWMDKTWGELGWHYEETLGDIKALKDLKEQFAKGTPKYKTMEALKAKMDKLKEGQSERLKIIKIGEESPKSGQGQGQLGKKRGPYKKKDPNAVSAKAEIGGKTIKKYVVKINKVLNNAKHFTKAEIVAEVRTKYYGSELAGMGGKETLLAVNQAKWRLDGRRRRKLGLNK